MTKYVYVKKPSFIKITEFSSAYRGMYMYVVYMYESVMLSLRILKHLQNRVAICRSLCTNLFTIDLLVAKLLIV